MPCTGRQILNHCATREAPTLGSLFAPALSTRKGREGRGARPAAAKGRLSVQAGAQTKHTHQAVTYQLCEAQEALKPQVGACEATFPGERKPRALLYC